MSRKPVTNPEFHDSSDPRCAQHARSGEPSRPDRHCPKCRPAGHTVSRNARRRAVRP